MANLVQFDRAALAAVKPGMDAALDAAYRHVSTYIAAPHDNALALSEARKELHRVMGVLKLLDLQGLQVFTTEIKTVLDELVDHSSVATTVHGNVVLRALTGLIHFLDALVQGADNATLRLYPKYEALQCLRGMEMSFEQDLFFPNLHVRLPDEVLSVVQQVAGTARLKTARSQYQQGLVRWMRQDGTEQGWRMMQQALVSALACLPAEDDDDGRAVCWVAGGVLDCLEGVRPELESRRLLGCIDQQLRALVKGDRQEQAAFLNQMLYVIGRSQTLPSERVTQIRQVYALDVYLPQLAKLSASEVAQALAHMNEQIHLAEESWEQCVTGDAQACTRFVEIAGKITKQTAKLQQNTPQYLTKNLEALASHLLDPKYARLIGMDVAMALLLWQNGVTHFEHLDARFQEQSRILSERIAAAANQQPEDVARMAELITLYCQMERDALLVPLGKEMQDNLQQVEQKLNEYLEDTSQPAEWTRLQQLLTQIHGGLSVLSLEHAAQLVNALRKQIQSFNAGDASPKLKESHALASAVTALGHYLQQLPHGGQDDIAPLQNAQVELSKLHLSSAALPLAASGIESSAEEQRPIGEDQEILDVFLEEAEEVLGIMRDNIELCQLDVENKTSLVVIRRGFHTLKGSGRMVGLTDFGEVAWAVERALNKWLLERATATPTLLKFIQHAEQAFSTWVEELQRAGGVRVVAPELIAWAQKIEQGVDADIEESPSVDVLDSAIHPETDIAEIPSEDITSEIAPAEIAPTEIAPTLFELDMTESLAGEPEQVVIGEVSLSPTLFTIASEEAKQHIQALHEQFALMHMSKPLQVPYDFMRAAHTLAGVNRTMGFTGVVELAKALEDWLHARIEKPFTLTNAQSQMLVQSIVALENMVLQICDRKAPLWRGDLVSQLHFDQEKLHEPSPSGEVRATEGGIDSAVPLHPVKAVAIDAPHEEQVQDDLDEQLLPVFLEEADELSPKLGVNLRAWQAQPEDDSYAQLLKRLLHTLKGSARMAGAMRIGDIAHNMEDHVLQTAQMQAQAGHWQVLEDGLDHINALLESLRSGKPVETVVHRRASDAESPRTAEFVPRRALDIGAERAIQANMLRVRSDVVDRLVNEASEISVARARMETEMRAFKDGLLELTGSVARLRKQLREVEIQAESQMQARVSLSKDSDEQFDPLEFDRFTRLQELTRFMNESVHDVQTVQQALLKNMDETAAAMSAQARMNRELQQGLMNVRMVPFSSVSERLYRIVRQTAKDLHKRANLELFGTTVEMDRSVLEKMTAPFEHLLRNAVVHGLGDGAQRSAAGKNEIGEIRLSLRQESNEVVFEFSDDGAGLNYAALREKANQLGLLMAGMEVNEEQLAQLIFTPGLSTATEVTEVAGRGVGMDVVRSEIAALGGRIDVSSTTGKGTQFTIHLPLTLAVTQTLLVRSGEAFYALPATMVEQVSQVKSAALTALYQVHQVVWQGKTYPLHYLAHLLGEGDKVPENQPRNSVLLLRSGEQRIALHVDELLGNQEAVVKNIGPQLARMSGIAGATVTGDGAVLLILNPVQLSQRIVNTPRRQQQAAVEVLRTQPLVMVVDDSLTVRKITTRLLTRAGYQVVTAKDGVDALEQLTEITPQVMLLDVEMPRMDGFELTKQLRRDAQTRDVPIIMITSRTADKHKDYAMGLGVNEYLGKPYQEEQLLHHIARLLELNNHLAG